METNEEKSRREELERFLKDFKLPERDPHAWMVVIPSIISILLTIGAVCYAFATMPHNKGGIPECRCVNVKTQ